MSVENPGASSETGNNESRFAANLVDRVSYWKGCSECTCEQRCHQPCPAEEGLPAANTICTLILQPFLAQSWMISIAVARVIC